MPQVRIYGCEPLTKENPDPKPVYHGALAWENGEFVGKDGLDLDWAEMFLFSLYVPDPDVPGGGRGVKPADGPRFLRGLELAFQRASMMNVVYED
jgi:hypothetical protein